MNLVDMNLDSLRGPLSGRRDGRAVFRGHIRPQPHAQAQTVKDDAQAGFSRPNGSGVLWQSAPTIDNSGVDFRSRLRRTSRWTCSSGWAKLVLRDPHKVPTADLSSLSDSPTRALIPRYSVAQRS